ncbi:MAG: hypothetical protein ACRENP_26760 [Longimicrobiales bacterium]
MPSFSRNHGRSSAIGALAFLALIPGTAGAQRSIEVHVGGGQTVVDVQQASGQSGSVRAEEQGMFQLFARVLLLPVGKSMLGVEAGYRYLYYYEVPSPPFGFVARDVAPTFIAGVLKVPLVAGLALEAGAGAHFYEETTSLGVFGAAGYDIRLGARLAIPIRARADLLLEDPAVIPVGATLGLAVRF